MQNASGYKVSWGFRIDISALLYNCWLNKIVIVIGFIFFNNKVLLQHMQYSYNFSVTFGRG